MKSRKPSFDFSETPAHWAKLPEFSQSMNAPSVWIPHLERFLNRVMSRSLKEMSSRNTGSEQLRQDVRMFIRQEANHYTLHESFNAILGRNGYEVADLEEHFKKEFERLLATKSLAFLCAYCEGFETVSPAVAALWLSTGMDSFIAGARPEVVDLWKWHLMEEFEHRTVCFDVFHEIHGGYFMRLYGFFYQLVHLKRFSNMVQKRLYEKDRSNMTAEEIKASKKKEKAIHRQFTKMTVPYLIKAMSPFHNPRKAKEPLNYRSYMGEVEATLIPAKASVIESAYS